METATYRRHQLRSRQRASDARGEADAAPEVEVTNLDRAEAVAVHAQDVLRLEVPVRHALAVQEVQRVGELANNLRRLRL